MSESYSCIYCHSELLQAYKFSYGHLIRCKYCGSEFLHADKEVQYNKNYYRSWFCNSNQKTEVIKRTNFKKLLSTHFDTMQNKKLLDIGCATGFLLQEAESLGAEIYGIDINEWAAKQAKRKLPNAKIFVGQINQAIEEEFFSQEYFDIIVGTDVIEHIADAKLFLKDVLKIMKKGGKAAFTTPDLASLSHRMLGPYWYQYKCEHVGFITRKALSLLSSEMGFNIEKITPVKKVLTLGYLFSVIRNTGRAPMRWIGSLGETCVNCLFLTKARFLFRTGEMLFIISKL